MTFLAAMETRERCIYNLHVLHICNSLGQVSMFTFVHLCMFKDIFWTSSCRGTEIWASHLSYLQLFQLDCCSCVLPQRDKCHTCVAKPRPQPVYALVFFPYRHNEFTLLYINLMYIYWQRLDTSMRAYCIFRYTCIYASNTMRVQLHSRACMHVTSNSSYAEYTSTPTAHVCIHARDSFTCGNHVMFLYTCRVIIPFCIHILMCMRLYTYLCAWGYTHTYVHEAHVWGPWGTVSVLPLWIFLWLSLP